MASAGEVTETAEHTIAFKPHPAESLQVQVNMHRRLCQWCNSALLQLLQNKGRAPGRRRTTQAKGDEVHRHDRDPE
jgi:hypothetical protein